MCAPWWEAVERGRGLVEAPALSLCSSCGSGRAPRGSLGGGGQFLVLVLGWLLGGWFGVAPWGRVGVAPWGGLGAPWGWFWGDSLGGLGVAPWGD